MLDIKRWLEFVREVGVRQEGPITPPCDLCRASDISSNTWMTKELFKSHPDEVIPIVCEEHGRQHGLIW